MKPSDLNLLLLQLRDACDSRHWDEADTIAARAARAIHAEQSRQRRRAASR